MAQKIMGSCILLIITIYAYLPSAHAATVSFTNINDTNPVSGFKHGGGTLTTQVGNTLVIDASDFSLSVAGADF